MSSKNKREFHGLFPYEEVKWLTTEDVPGSVRSDDSEYQKAWKDIYCHCLWDYRRGHDKVFCGDDNAISKMLQLIHTDRGEVSAYRWIPAAQGVYRRFIYVGNLEDSAARILVIDVDSASCWGKWADWGIPEPHLEVVNPASGNVQWHYLLSEPVYDMTEYFRVVRALTDLVQDGTDHDGYKNLQYRSPFLKMNGVRKKWTTYLKGKLQAPYALVIPHWRDTYTLAELNVGSHLSVVTSDRAIPKRSIGPEEAEKRSRSREVKMFDSSWKACAQFFRDNGGVITYEEVFCVYKNNAALVIGKDALPEHAIAKNVRRFMKWVEKDRDSVLSWRGPTSSLSIIGIVNPPSDFHSPERQRSRVNKRWNLQREFVGETKTDAAARLGVSRVTLDKWIRLGKRIPTVKAALQNT